MVQQLAIDSFYSGIFMDGNMEIGTITSQVRLKLPVTSRVASMSMMSLVKATLPGHAVLFVFLILETRILWISAFMLKRIMWPVIILE